jgi:hypothetical protein
MAAINLLTNSTIDGLSLNDLINGTETLDLLPSEHTFYIHQNITNGSAPQSSGVISVHNCKAITAKNSESDFLLTVGLAVKRGDKIIVHPAANDLYAPNTGLFHPSNKADKNAKETAFIEFLITRILHSLYQRNDVIAKSLSANIYPQKQITDEMRAIETAIAKLTTCITRA